MLVQVASASIIIGVPLILAAWAAGPARWAVALRRFWAPHLEEHPPLAYWITGGLLVLIFIWGPIPATRNPLEMLLFTILAFVGAHVFRRQIAEEFPDAQATSWRASMGEAAHTVGEKIGRARAVAAPTTAATTSKSDELERLAGLRDRGALTRRSTRRPSASFSPAAEQGRRRPAGGYRPVSAASLPDWTASANRR